MGGANVTEKVGEARSGRNRRETSEFLTPSGRSRGEKRWAMLHDLLFCRRKYAIFLRVHLINTKLCLGGMDRPIGWGISRYCIITGVSLWSGAQRKLNNVCAVRLLIVVARTSEEARRAAHLLPKLGSVILVLGAERLAPL